jgi:hypothetical protein
MTAASKPLHSPRFLIVFVAALLAVGALAFYGFSTFQTQAAALRQKQSWLNLIVMRNELNAFAHEHGGHFPTALNEWLPNVPSAQRINPAWPDEPGYVYIPGAALGDNPEDTILIYENTPARKRKLGTFALRNDGCVDRFSDAELGARLDRQKRSWKLKERLWSPELILATPRF